MCMESLPDTALYLLKSIPHIEKLRGKLQADYALLLTQAMDQNYVKFTSDSLIALALNYYTVEHGDSVTRAKAQYYYGRVLRELGKDEEALSFLSSAKEMFGKIQCCKMFAMATDEIGMVNRKKKLYQESLKNFQESYAIYEELKDSLSLVRAGQNIGRAYLFQNKWDSCYFYYTYALELAREKQYPSEVSILHELGILYRSMGELKKSERYFLAAYEKEIDQSVISDYKEISGYGISVMAGEKKVFAGNTKLMDTECIEYTTCEKAGTKVYLAVDGQYAGCILITDEVKPDSKKAISDLKHIGVEKTVMLTGDDEKIGKSVAEELQLDKYYAQLLPDQKVEKVELLDSKKRPGSKLAFVGDGINDAPVLARADVGIAMGGLGSDAAIEAADVVLMTDEPSKLVDAIEVAKATKQIVMQNIVIALGIKSVFLILGALGIAGMWEAVFGDVGVTIIAVLNAMRILKK